MQIGLYFFVQVEEVHIEDLPDAISVNDRGRVSLRHGGLRWRVAFVRCSHDNLARMMNDVLRTET